MTNKQTLIVEDELSTKTICHNGILENKLNIEKLTRSGSRLKIQSSDTFNT